MITESEKAAVTFDMFLTGLCRIEMVGHGDSFGSKHRLITLIEGLLEEYTESDNRPDDMLRQDVFRRVLEYLKR